MRVFAISDIHVDYDANAKWVHRLSTSEYRDDILILAGDVTHRLPLLASCLEALTARFCKVLFVPGNHDLWVLGEAKEKTSLEKFSEVVEVVEACGASMAPFCLNGVLIVPLLGWYDYSFGEPSADLMSMWMDFRACRWPDGFEVADVAAYFAQLNCMPVTDGALKVISFSHFLPRLDLVPGYVPRKHRVLDPVLGSTQLEAQLRRLKPAIHVYGHSHINRSVCLDGIQYVNSALGYPQEEMISARQFLCIDTI